MTARRTSRFGHRALRVGVNDLQTLRPDIARTLVEPSLATQLTLGSQIYVRWFCVGTENAAHPRYEWDGPTAVRVNGHRCGVCSNRAAVHGWNDLSTLRPDLAQQLVNPSLAMAVTVGSSRSLDWFCEGTSETPHPWFAWSAPVKNRARGHGCPVCAGTRVISGWNDLETLRPSLALRMVDPSAAKTLSLWSNRKVAWSCEGTASSPHDHLEWDAPVSARMLASGDCPQCATSGFDPLGEGWVYRGSFSHAGEDALFFGKTNIPRTRIQKYQSGANALPNLREIELYRVGRGSDATVIEDQLRALLTAFAVPTCGARGFRAGGVIREGFFLTDTSDSFMAAFDQIFFRLGKPKSILKTPRQAS